MLISKKIKIKKVVEIYFASFISPRINMIIAFLSQGNNIFTIYGSNNNRIAVYLNPDLEG